jgi:hypothetical protein
MKLFKRIGIAALLAVCAVAWAGSAWADVVTTITHVSTVPLRNGEPVYNEAEFSFIDFYVDYTPGLSDPPQDGSFELEGAYFTTSSGFVNEGALFECQLVLDYASPDTTEYTTALNGSRITFRGEAGDDQRGLPNKAFQWNIGSDTGSGNVKDFLTTLEQVAQNAAPYVQLSDTVLEYRVLVPSASRVRIRLYNTSGTRVDSGGWIDALEGSIDLAAKNLNGNDIARVEVQVRLAKDTEDILPRYTWNFRKAEIPPVQNAESVAQIIRAYGLSAAVSGNTITVTGNVDKDASNVLYLGDISGLVIDWKAGLTVTGGSRPSKGVGMINFSNGEFNLTDGTIQLPASANTWVDGIYAIGNATVRVAGGKVLGDRPKATGIYVEDGAVIIDSGEVTIPYGGTAVYARTLTVNNAGVLTGLAHEGDRTSYTTTVYGHAITVTDSEVFYNKYDEGDPLPDLISNVVPKGAIWDIEGVSSDMTGLPTVAAVKMTVKSGGTLNIIKNTHLKFKGSLLVEEGGTLYIDETSKLNIVGGKMTINGSSVTSSGTRAAALDSDNGILNNSGTFTIAAGSTLTNNGIINNASTGTITNEGKIDNISGTITNEGKIDNTSGTINNEGTIKSDPVNFTGNVPVGNPVESDNGSGGGGCNAGFGLFGLLLAGLVTRKYRKA